MGIPKISPFLTRWGLFVSLDLRYLRGMITLPQLATDITHKRGLVLILTQDSAHQSKTELIAYLILKGPLFVLSGDEWLPSFVLPRVIREQTTEVKAILNRLHTARASTCYRLFDSLANIAPVGDPIFVLEFLHTFYDEDIPLRTRLYKLRESCRELKRLAFHRPVIVMTRQVGSQDYEKFLPALSSIADRTLTLEAEVDPISQPRLF
jgi:hypothetical protein